MNGFKRERVIFIPKELLIIKEHVGAVVGRGVRNDTPVPARLNNMYSGVHASTTEPRKT